MPAVLVIVLAAFLLAPGGAAAGTVPPGFQETTAFSGLVNPTVVRFAPDGRVFVAEKSGLIQAFDGVGDPTPTVVADLRTQVHNFWDRGLLGMALSPDWAEDPSLFVTYTHDAAIGGVAPRWGTPGATADPCPNPPGATGDGCVVSGRISRLSVSGGLPAEETVLVEDYCQQYPSHSVGSVEFGPGGWLYATGGDGASFNNVDYGQDGDPVNPCGDPPGGVGAALTPPTAEGGALRSQDLRTRSDPAGLAGTIVRIDPQDGAGAPANPYGDSADANERRILAHGLRNPFRFALNDTGEVYVGDVGLSTWEEINRLEGEGVVNFGWPCYEGGARQPNYDGAGLAICEALYVAGPVSPPLFAYAHAQKVVPGESCPSGGSAIAGLRFYDGPTFPAAYNGALFFADYIRDCIWSMRAGPDGAPDPSTVTTFDAGAANPVWLEIGPDGALYYADFDGGRIQRVQYLSPNQPPLAVATAEPASGNAPLEVDFDGTGSSDPDPGDTITFAWDLDGDGAYDDSEEAEPTHVYDQAGTYDASLRVRDDEGASATAPVTIVVSNQPPVPAISKPAASRLWRVGKDVAFEGSADDPQEGQLPASALDWTVNLEHCPSDCHTHPIEDFEGRASGSFVGPDHEFPARLELTLTATDAGGLSASTMMRIKPRTVKLRLLSSHRGLRIGHNATTRRAPFVRRVIHGSTNAITAPSPQARKGQKYVFRRWSDGGARTHDVVPKTSRDYRADFRRR